MFVQWCGWGAGWPVVLCAFLKCWFIFWRHTSGLQTLYLSSTNSDGTDDYCKQLGWKKLQEYKPTQKAWKYLSALAEGNAIPESILPFEGELEEEEYYYPSLPFAALFSCLKVFFAMHIQDCNKWMWTVVPKHGGFPLANTLFMFCNKCVNANWLQSFPFQSLSPKCVNHELRGNFLFYLSYGFSYWIRPKDWRSHAYFATAQKGTTYPMLSIWLRQHANFWTWVPVISRVSFSSMNSYNYFTI